MTVHLVSLGCVRNLVDSELMLGTLAKAGFIIVSDPADAKTIIINTCGFVRDAVDESIDTILELARFKEQGQCERLVICGCMAQRYGDELKDALPEVDVIAGPGAHSRIVSLLKRPAQNLVCMVPDPSLARLQSADDPRLCSTAHIAYIKISEGCPDKCTFCMIPKLRGKWRSRPPQDILEEVKNLMAQEAKEIILVAQDTTAYGQDFGKGNQISLAGLLARMCELPGSARFRFLYGHPNRVSNELLEIVAKNSRICAYFDVPVQHASDSLLKTMGRQYTGEKISGLFESIRKKVPNAAIRSTALVGFPGETEEDFEKLMDLARTVCFDHLGVFIYSDAEELASHGLPGHVPIEVAENRKHRLMSLQKTISIDNNAMHVGKKYQVLVTGPSIEPGYKFSGRTFFQAPDVDGVTFIKGEGLKGGDVVDLRVTDAGAYDLWA